MIEIKKTDIFGWESAIRGMRNPMNSWDKSDSEMRYGGYGGWEHEFYVGENDLKLMKTLANAGSDHGKFLRMINVTVDINAPLYWWKEFDTYKVGTVANSCSTMHKIHAKEFTLDNFSHEHLTHYSHDGELCRDWLGDLVDLIDNLNFAREKYLECDEALKNKTLNQEDRKLYTALRKQYWWQMIQLLPSSYNQLRTVQLNYQVLKSMYHARKNHKLDEWHDFCAWCETLPNFKELCLGE